MFQQVFQAQNPALMIFPLVGLFLFIGLFFFQVIRIWRAPKSAIHEQANLPLADDNPTSSRGNR